MADGGPPPHRQMCLRAPPPPALLPQLEEDHQRQRRPPRRPRPLRRCLPPLRCRQRCQTAALRHRPVPPAGQRRQQQKQPRRQAGRQCAWCRPRWGVPCAPGGAAAGAAGLRVGVSNWTFSSENGGRRAAATVEHPAMLGSLLVLPVSHSQRADLHEIRTLWTDCGGCSSHTPVCGHRSRMVTSCPACRDLSCRAASPLPPATTGAAWPPPCRPSASP